jgi:hypothetical protein
VCIQYFNVFLILNLVFNLNYQPSHPMLTLGFHHTEILDYLPSTFLADDTVFSFVDLEWVESILHSQPFFQLLVDASILFSLNLLYYR